MPWKGLVVVTEEEDRGFEDGSTKIVNEFQFTSPAVIYWPLRINCLLHVSDDEGKACVIPALRKLSILLHRQCVT